MKVKIVDTGEVISIAAVPDNIQIEILDGILKGKQFNSSDVRYDENFECE